MKRKLKKKVLFFLVPRVAQISFCSWKNGIKLNARTHSTNTISSNHRRKKQQQQQQLVGQNYAEQNNTIIYAGNRNSTCDIAKKYIMFWVLNCVLFVRVFFIFNALFSLWQKQTAFGIILTSTLQMQILANTPILSHTARLRENKWISNAIVRYVCNRHIKLIYDIQIVCDLTG